ncbi:MAG: hypothetical protein ACI8RD_009088 [Bacillariaceae sp.]|jgi:hypothetical protein
MRNDGLKKDKIQHNNVREDSIEKIEEGHPILLLSVGSVGWVCFGGIEAAPIKDNNNSSSISTIINEWTLLL